MAEHQLKQLIGNDAAALVLDFVMISKEEVRERRWQFERHVASGNGFCMYIYMSPFQVCMSSSVPNWIRMAGEVLDFAFNQHLLLGGADVSYEPVYGLGLSVHLSIQLSAILTEQLAREMDD